MYEICTQIDKCQKLRFCVEMFRATSSWTVFIQVCKKNNESFRGNVFEYKKLSLFAQI